MIPISSPVLDRAEQEAASAVLASGRLAQGPCVTEFEHAFADYVGVKHAVATSNGTTALHAALLAHGIGDEDEVITTPFTFIASVNAIIYAGARPVLVDIDDSFNIDASQIEAAVSRRTRAIMPVHLYGQPSAMDAIMQVAREHGLAVIEDACQAHGAEFAGRKVGSFGTGCFSFYATKNMTTGEGGMVTTNDDEIADKARLVINHGVSTRYHHEILGYNYRMTDIAAAIGIVQLKKLPTLNARRREIAGLYDQRLGKLTGLILPRVFPNRSHVFHQYTVRITRDFGSTRDEVADFLKEKAIATGIYYPIPVHRQRSLQQWELANCPFAVTEQMAEEVLSIPVHPGLSPLDVEHVIDAIKSLGGMR
ncbi:MAG: DegT/DnrJ/EryC1/StrS family aminotransferase [Chloroflexi bacterium]|nr:DegT/DnrJ/EryC1/StrS family aminotransferase [Chloroflexota bacterium]